MSSLGGLLGQLGDDRPEVTVLISGPGDAGIAVGVDDPGEDRRAAGQALDHWRPDALVLIGSAFRPAIVAAAAARAIPVIGMALRGSAQSWMMRWPFRPLARRHLDGFFRLMCEDDAARVALLRAGAPKERTEVAGLLARDIRVPPASEAERQSLSDLITTRPVWCAAMLPATEMPLILAAHRLAVQRSHRLLLVVVPADPADGPAMRDAAAADGLTTGLRSAGEDPNDGISVYLADLGGELGLWLRLAPIAWIGGSATAHGTTASPMDAATLGSAILHGPSTGAHAADFARLGAAGAARMLKTAEDIAAAVDALIQPDEAATMAHAAWQVSSAGEDAATRAMQVLSGLLDRGTG